MTDIHIIPILQDNYSYIIRHENLTAVVDPGAAEPIADFLKSRGWALNAVLLTHHHNDHIDGAAELAQTYSADIAGPASETARMPVKTGLKEGDIYKLGTLDIHVLETPGHTRGHIVFFLPGAKILFSGDTLFSMGCGRLFEGTPEQMWAGLQKIAALPDDTLIYCGHEYTESNGRFALAVDPHNSDVLDRMDDVMAARMAGKPTLPVSLAMEKRTNPFLRAETPAKLGELRAMKDRF